MSKAYRAERAVSPSDGAVSWVVVDGAYELHAEGCAFLAGLRGLDRSINTERVYAGRVALFLSWCAAEGIDWMRVELGQMVRFKRWLVSEPLPTRGRGQACPARHRSTVTADAILATVCEFLRFCARHGLVAAELVKCLHEPRYLSHLPPGYEAGEDEQFRMVRSRSLRYVVPQAPFDFIEPERIDELVTAARNVRDRFLVALIGMTGVRIGEVLGLRQRDMHLLSDSRDLGCAVSGPHLHVRRRPDNDNAALAKSRFPPPPGATGGGDCRSPATPPPSSNAGRTTTPGSTCPNATTGGCSPLRMGPPGRGIWPRSGSPPRYAAGSRPSPNCTATFPAQTAPRCRSTVP